MIDQAASALRRILRGPYDSYVREHTPRRWGTYNGVELRKRRLFDVTRSHPEMKAGLVEAVRELVEEGDRAVDIAAGWGLVSTHLAWSGATVVTYEGSAKMLREARRTFRRNGVADAVELRHAVVGEANHVRGGPGDAARISPADLPAMDLLVLDCEGAEKHILEHLPEAPPKVVVESHPDYGASDGVVRDLLEDLGLTVSDRPYEPNAPTPEGKRVLTGVD